MIDKRTISEVDDPDQAYELGKRDGYEEAVQDVDRLTGGDGEYRYCMGVKDERHCPDVDTMKRRIAERFATSARPSSPAAVYTVGEPDSPSGWFPILRNGHWTGACARREDAQASVDALNDGASARTDQHADTRRLLGDMRAVLAHHRFTAARVGQPGCEVRKIAAEHAETIERAIAALSTPAAAPRFGPLGSRD